MYSYPDHLYLHLPITCGLDPSSVPISAYETQLYHEIAKFTPMNSIRRFISSLNHRRLPRIILIVSNVLHLLFVNFSLIVSTPIVHCSFMFSNVLVTLVNHSIVPVSSYLFSNSHYFPFSFSSHFSFFTDVFPLPLFCRANGSDKLKGRSLYQYLT